MKLLLLLCVHLLSPVLGQRGLLVNKRARQRLSSKDVHEMRRGSDDESVTQRFAKPARLRQRGGETGVGVLQGSHAVGVLQGSHQFAPLPNFKFKSENDENERQKTSYNLPVWDNPVAEYRKKEILTSRSKEASSRSRDQERSDDYSKRTRQSGRRQTKNGDNLQSTDERYYFQEVTHPRQVTEKPRTIDYDSQKLPEGKGFSEPQRLLEDFTIEDFTIDDSYEPHRLPSQEDFSYSQLINAPSPKDRQYVSISKPNQSQQNEFQQDFQYKRNNYDNVYEPQQDFQLEPQEDFQLQPQEDFPFKHHSEFDSPKRLTEQNLFEPSLEVQTKSPFLPTPIPQVFYPSESTESNFTPKVGENFGGATFSKITSYDDNGYVIESNDADKDFIEGRRYIPITEVSVSETTYRTTFMRRRQGLQQRHSTVTTDASFWYEETTTGYRELTSKQYRSRSRARHRQKPSSEINNLKNAVETKTFRRQIPRRRIIKRPKEIPPFQDEGSVRTSDPRGQTSNKFHSRLGTTDENSLNHSSRKNTRRRPRFRSRSRSRLNSAAEQPFELKKPRLNENPRLTEAIERLNEHIDNKLKESPRRLDIETKRLPTKIESNRLPSIKTSKSKHSSPSSFVKFPKRNLFPHLPKVKFAPPKHTNNYFDNNVIDSGRLPKSISSEESFIPIQDIQPTRPILKPEFKKPIYDFDYQSVDIQSSKNNENDGYITVTHQAKAPTVYTILEGKETKQLHAVVKTTSLQIVDVQDLTSTEIDGVGIVFAHVITNYPQAGVKQFKFDKIEPSTTQYLLSSDVTIAGRRTMLTETVRSTFYNVKTMTARITETPRLDVKTSFPSALEELVKTIIASLLGKNLLSNNVIDDAAPIPYTKFKTHTRSYLTQTSSTQTIVIPVTLRGQEVLKTVTDIVTDTITTTEYSIQTVIDYAKPSTPFLPLAPTLHRAARVIPSIPMINPINIQPVSTTQYLTHAVASTATLTEDATTPVIITLGGREVQTSFVRPTIQIVTITSYSTQTLIQPVATQFDNPSNKLANIIRNLKFLQNLRQR